MAQTTTGIRAALSHPVVYDIWSRVVGGRRAQTILLREHIHPHPGARLLDLGCGTGELLEFLGDQVVYTGIDVSPEYIRHARAQFGDRAKFFVADATQPPAEYGRFDLVVAIGVLHHLDDREAAKLFAGAAAALDEGGRMITADPAFAAGQSRAARLAISHDRGRNVRDPLGYRDLAARSFGSVSPTVRDDLIRIPYTHCVLECVKREDRL